MEEGYQRNSTKRGSSSASGDKVDHRTKRQRHAAQFVDLTGDKLNDSTDGICISLIEIIPTTESLQSVVKEEQNDVINLDTDSDHDVTMRNHEEQNELDSSVMIIPSPESSTTVYSEIKNKAKATASTVIQKENNSETQSLKSATTILPENRNISVTVSKSGTLVKEYSHGTIDRTRLPDTLCSNGSYGNTIENYRPPIRSSGVIPEAQFRSGIQRIYPTYDFVQNDLRRNDELWYDTIKGLWVRRPLALNQSYQDLDQYHYMQAQQYTGRRLYPSSDRHQAYTSLDHRPVTATQTYTPATQQSSHTHANRMQISSEKTPDNPSTSKNCESATQHSSHADANRMQRSSEQKQSNPSTSKNDGSAPWYFDHTGANRTQNFSEKQQDRIKRKWKSVEKEPVDKSVDHKTFTIASYNILAQNLLDEHMDLYRRCDPECLTWENRGEGLIKEIKLLRPDILCLQEVYVHHYMDFLREKLKELGYESAYKKRTQDKKDGCATFYLKGKLVLNKTRKVEYLKPNAYPLDRDNVALLTEFCFKKVPHERLVVANTHLLFNPKRGDVKLGQMMILLSEIEQFSYERYCNPENPKYAPVILCGDFNSQPFSHLYNFIQKGCVNHHGLPSASISGQECDRRGSGQLMGKQVIPMSVGISDQCQYLDVVNKRLQYLESHRINQEAKRKQCIVKQGVKPHKDATVQKDCLLDKPVKTVNICRCSCCKECYVKDKDEGKCRRAEGFSYCSQCSKASARSEEKVKPKNVSCLSPAEKDMVEIVERLSLLTQTEIPDSARSKEPNKTKCTFASGRLQHDLKLTSVYEHARAISGGGKNSPEITTHHGKTSCTVDYIFYTKNQEQCLNPLVLQSQFELPTKEDMIGQYLPNRECSSDHVILLAQFRFILQKKKGGKS